MRPVCRNWSYDLQRSPCHLPAHRGRGDTGDPGRYVTVALLGGRIPDGPVANLPPSHSGHFRRAALVPDPVRTGDRQRARSRPTELRVNRRR